MGIAIIICMHGKAAEELLKTTEMLIGMQDNVACIDFLPGENSETLLEKYHDKARKLDSSNGVIFLVDSWGGSPFNAASRIAVDQSSNEVITGVNIPMLLETLMSRDDNPKFEDLVEIALKTGREGVKSLKNPHTAVVSSTVVTAKPAIYNEECSQNNHMIIALARIDDRLIHGQVVTRWTKETQVSRIIVVSDEVAADNVRKTLLTQVAPPGVSGHVVNLAKAIRVWNNPQYAGERVMLLFTNPTDVWRLIEGGVAITSVNIGGMAFRKGKTQVNNAISIDKIDIEAFKRLDERGVKLEVRKVSSDSPLKMMDLVNKFN